MRRKALVGILVVLMFVSIIGMFGTAGASAGEGQYQKEIIIKENSGKALTDYPIPVDLKGADFPSKAEIDGADIRFYDAEGKELSYWIEEYDCSGKTAKIWVKVPSIPLNGEVKIKMYYGNEKTGSVSDRNAVFELFDDFSGYSVDQSKWYLEGTPSISNGILHLNRVGGADESIKSKVKYGDNYAMRTKALFYDVSNKQAAFIGFLDAAAHAPHAIVQTYLPYYNAGDVVGGHTNDKKVNIMDTLGEYTNRFYAYEVRRINGGASYYVEGSPEIRQPASIGVDLPIKARAEIADGAKVDLDWIFIRKCNSPEPTVTVEGGGGLLAYYPFSGNANDESGNGLHGTVYGAVLTEDRLGNADNAFLFDNPSTIGTNRIVVTDGYGFNKGETLESLTISSWFLPYMKVMSVHTSLDLPVQTELDIYISTAMAGCHSV